MRKNDGIGLGWHQILVTAIILCIIAGLAIYGIDFFNYKSKISSIQLHEIAFSDIADGQYLGEYDAGYIYAKVQVNVENGSVQNIILLEHKNERGKAAEQIVSTIVDTQTFPVDAVSSATNSSLVIQKAVENALEGGHINE
ncbi:MAG: FMN-binding protein [Lachnospiraceae bacterium]|nr:FMN-binding protein [Lachnospiraceae bacterium]